ncbi:hypothetical protein GCM10010327_06400 [Streptomyces nitrosporeus]|nr:hypothetical protein GCM10010327_06400 [Streptomyces nitrosporeus]
MGGQGAAQGAGAAEAGEDEGAAAGQLLVQFGRRRQPVDAGEVDVYHGHIGFGRQGGGDDRVTPVDGRDHVQVRLQLE